MEKLFCGRVRSIMHLLVFCLHVKMVVLHKCPLRCHEREMINGMSPIQEILGASSENGDNESSEYSHKICSYASAKDMIISYSLCTTNYCFVEE